MPELIPDDNPGAGYYLTLKDVAQLIRPHLSSDEDLNYVLDQLDNGEPVALGAEGGFLLVFVPDGVGLFRALLKEEPDAT